MKIQMKRCFNLICIGLILFIFFNINKVFATDVAQVQELQQNVEQNVDTSKKLDGIGIYKLPDDLTYSDSSKIYLNGGILLFKFEDGTYQFIDMMSPDVTRIANFDGDTDNIIINFSYNNVLINGNVLLQKSFDNLIHNTIVGEGSENNVRGFSIKVAPKYSYIQNYDKLDLRNGVLDVYYTDGSLGIVKMTDPDVVVEGFDNTVPGIKELTVKYKGFEQKFKINILENFNPDINGNIPQDNIPEDNKGEFKDHVIHVPDNGPNNGGNNPNNPNNSNNPNNPTNPKGPDNTTAKGLLPQTGAMPIIIFTVCIFIFIIVFTYCKRKYINKGIRGM